MSDRSSPDRILDCRHLSCPLPVVRTAQAIKELDAGQVLLVMATDPGFALDIRAWSSRAGHDLMDVAEDGGAYHVLLRRS
ncbi:MAG: tRNA 2-thiouridine synthesizing protein [Actinomycetota bacterium]|nr:tRNA 2-thiouridine synthesizing protein [Actinomycetota bacterium]